MYVSIAAILDYTEYSIKYSIKNGLNKMKIKKYIKQTY